MIESVRPKIRSIDGLSEFNVPACVYGLGQDVPEAFYKEGVVWVVMQRPEEIDANHSSYFATDMDDALAFAKKQPDVIKKLIKLQFNADDLRYMCHVEINCSSVLRARQAPVNIDIKPVHLGEVYVVRDIPPLYTASFYGKYARERQVAEGLSSGDANVVSRAVPRLLDYAQQVLEDMESVSKISNGGEFSNLFEIDRFVNIHLMHRGNRGLIVERILESQGFDFKKR